MTAAPGGKTNNAVLRSIGAVAAPWRVDRARLKS